MSILTNGRYAPVTPIDFVCEATDCFETKHVREYIRNKDEEIAGWEGEPICLCKKHSAGHKIHVPND